MSTQDDSRDSLADLHETEKRVLAQLVRLMVRSDGEFSDAERAQIDSVADQVGADFFWKCMDLATSSEKSDAEQLTSALQVKNVAAQELIYGTLYELCIADGADQQENDLLEKLATTWNLKIEDQPAE